MRFLQLHFILSTCFLGTTNSFQGFCSPRATLALRAKKSWSVADDWEALSASDRQGLDSNDVLKGYFRGGEVEQGETQQWEDLSQNDQFITEAVDAIQHYGCVYEPESGQPALYDTDADRSKTMNFEDEMGQELSMLVRCNESPETMLVQEGRALPTVSEAELNDVSQLVEQDDVDDELRSSVFLREAVSVMFQEHATSRGKSGEPAMDAPCVAKWMFKSLGGSAETRPVTSHDKRVLTTISRFGDYGNGYLTEANFQTLYWSAVKSALDGSSRKEKKKWKIDQPSVQSVFRDIRNHGILTPVDLEWAAVEHEIRQRGAGSATSAELKAVAQSSHSLMDECEILELTESSQPAYSTSSSSRERSSHERVTMTEDGKTPLWVKDGEFGKSRLCFRVCVCLFFLCGV